MQRVRKDAQPPQFPDFRVHVLHCGILINYRKVPDWSRPEPLQANERAGISSETEIFDVEWDSCRSRKLYDEALPDSWHPVAIQRTVVADNRHILGLRLGDEHSVKGIFVRPWQ